MSKCLIKSTTFLGVSRPVGILCEFMQWTGKNTRSFLRFIRSSPQIVIIERHANIGGRPEIEVRTHYTILEIHPGNWVMKSPSGDLNQVYFESKSPLNK